MPSMSKMTPRQWAQVNASSKIGTYTIMDGIRNGPKRLDEIGATHLAEDVEGIIATGWIERLDGDRLGITEDGIRHLKSFV